jgi:hypothetical protein
MVEVATMTLDTSDELKDPTSHARLKFSNVIPSEKDTLVPVWFLFKATISIAATG